MNLQWVQDSCRRCLEVCPPAEKQAAEAFLRDLVLGSMAELVGHFPQLDPRCIFVLSEMSAKTEGQLASELCMPLVRRLLDFLAACYREDGLYLEGGRLDKFIERSLFNLCGVLLKRVYLNFKVHFVAV
jgi:hypothetical protein